MDTTTTTPNDLLPPPMTGSTFPLAAGEVYAGLSRDPDTGAWHHLILLPATTDKDLTWKEAIDWAKSVGGELPTRREQAMLFANRREGQYMKRWYWSCEPYGGDGRYAWLQYFGHGDQGFDHKDYRLRARAVRRVPFQ